jgi:hypothetical protein
MHIRRILVILLTTCLLNGCASYKKKFKNKTVANIGHFADSTIAMLSDLDMQLNREDTLLVRRFVDMSAPEELLVAKLNTDLKERLGNIVRYSIEIVNIAESDSAVTNKIQDYADYLIVLRGSVENHEEIDVSVFDDTIEQIRQQTLFVEALRKAQPLLNTVIMASALEIDELIEAIEVLSRKVDGRIDEEYTDIIRYRTKLEREKFDILTAFEIIYDAYRKNDPELSKLRESGVIWTPEIIPEGRPTRDDLKNIGSHLSTRMEALARIQEEMKPNWDDYLSTHRELDAIIDKTIRSAQHARIIMLTWVRAHQKMSTGKVSEADWFDIGETTKALIKNAPSAIL